MVKMGKRAQISVFLVVAVLVLVLGGLLIYSGQLPKTKDAAGKEVALSSSASSVSTFVNACLKQVADEAIDRHGYNAISSETGIKADIESGVPECTEDFESFKQQDISVAADTPTVSVSIQPTVVAVSLNWQLTITEGGQRSKISDFFYAYSRDRSIHLSSGQVLRTTALTSQDKKAELLFAQGIVVTDYDGNPVTSYSIKELDREEIAFPANVMSARVYELTPGEFSEPVKATLIYPENYNNPEELYVAWWDEENRIWHGIPTTRDTARKTLTAELEHATKVGVVQCTSEEMPIINITDTVFEQQCGRTVGKEVPGGSIVSGTCPDSIVTSSGIPINLWVQDANGLYIAARNKESRFIFTIPIIAKIEQNNESPVNQLSSPCVIKSWDGKDVKNDDISGCKANVPDAEKVNLQGKAAEDPDGRCVEVCTEITKSLYAAPPYGAYSAPYDNLQKSGGDGLEDGSKCECTRKGSDLECSEATIAKIANPPTPGYESGVAGGYGVLQFYIQSGGCVVDKDSKGTPDIAVYVSDQDPIINIKDAEDNPYKKAYEIVDNAITEGLLTDKAIAPNHYVINPTEDIDEDNFISFMNKAEKDATGKDTTIGLNPEGSDLKEGLNKIYLKVDEIQSQSLVSGCAHLWVSAQIKGVGIGSSCYGTWPGGPGDNRWYPKGALMCVSNRVARQCDGGSQGWSQWPCDLNSPDEFCSMYKKGCVKKCTKEQVLNASKIPSDDYKYDILIDYYSQFYVHTGDSCERLDENNCHGREPRGPGSGVVGQNAFTVYDRWYPNGTFICQTDKIARQCDGGSQGWSSWLCGPDEYCIQPQKGCVKACTARDLISLQGGRPISGRFLPLKSYYFENEEVCVSTVQVYKCVARSSGKLDWAQLPATCKTGQ